MTIVFAGRWAAGALVALAAYALILSCTVAPPASGAPLIDSDGDGLSNRFERLRSHTRPRHNDTDGDGLGDGDEVRRAGSDPLDTDSDDDGMNDAFEWLVGSDPNQAGPPWSPAPAPAPAPAPVPTPAPAPPGSCDVSAGSAAALRSAVAGHPGQTVCVTGAIGGSDLSGLRPAQAVTIRGADSAARVATLVANNSANLRFENLRFGGTPTARVANDIVTLMSGSDNIVFDQVEVAWSLHSGSGGDGFQIDNGGGNILDGIQVRRSRIHHIAVDGLQIAGAANFLLDRTEVGYVGPQPGSDEHADSIQVESFEGPNTRITNNWFHHLGYFDETSEPAASAPAGNFIWHDWGQTMPGGLVENNLFTDNRNYAWSWGRGVENLTARHNTVLRGGTAFGANAPSVIWATNGDGSVAGGKLAEANIIDRPSIGSSVAQQGNVWINMSGSGGNLGPFPVQFDANLNPTNLPAGHAGAGYRKPSGVAW